MLFFKYHVIVVVREGLLDNAAEGTDCNIFERESQRAGWVMSKIMVRILRNIDTQVQNLSF
jgi:hypothetical protein